MGPISVPKSRPNSGSAKLFVGHKNDIQAFALLRWWHYPVSRMPAGKQILSISSDETSMCRLPGVGNGNVFVTRAVHKISLGRRRMCMSHAGAICDVNEFQRLLPQFIIANEYTLKAR